MRQGPEPTLEQALSDATLVVHATVESAESVWVDDEWGRHIWTTYHLQVASYLKGSSRGDVVTLRILGGTVGETSEVVFDVLRPSLSQEALFLLSELNEDGPLALERLLAVEGDEVQLDQTTVPLSELAEAMAKLAQGESSTLKRILQRPTVATLPEVSDMSTELGSEHLGLKVGGGGSNPTDSLYAYFYDAWWSDFVDNDGDGYAQSGILSWDADVGGGSGSLTVYFDVFISATGTGQWTLLGSTGPHTITGASSSDSVSTVIPGAGAPTVYDFAIAVYQPGASFYDDELYPNEDLDLYYLGFEGSGYDRAPVINSISPSRGSAGTNTQVTINGSSFGSTQGLVTFFFQDTGNPLSSVVPADVISWSDTRILCTVPICAPGECGSYPGGTSSGPVFVVTTDGVLSTPAAFEVSFSYGDRRWNPPQVDYHIATSVPTAFSAALQNAGATWTSASGIGFVYSGSTTASVVSENGITEMVYGPLPPGIPADVLAVAGCWQQGSTITECDILFNSAQPFSTSTPTPPGSYDVESIALHEFGHWLELRDLYGFLPGYPSDTAKVMFGLNGGGPDWMKRTLHPDDVAGARWIYGTNNCTYSISPTSTSVAAAGGSGTLTVNTQAGCSWTATSNTSWITITGGSSGAGSGTVSYSVNANGSSSSRTGTIRAAGKTFTISQAGTPSCTYNISPTSATYGASGGNGSVSVSTTAGCTWTASSNNNSWIHITGGTSGTGSGTVSYSVNANGNSNSRTGTISVAGKTFAISQAGTPSCTYSISPTSATYGASGGDGSVSVSTTAGCTWSASSNKSWIHLTSGSSGTGSGNVNYSVDANSGNSRTGTLTIAGRTFTVTQSGGGGGSYRYEVAGVAHAGGAGGSVWRSTLCVTNLSGSTAELTLVYRMSGSTTTRTHMLQNNRIKEWADVAVSLFNQSGNTSGAIEITSSVPVMVVARTYNEAPDGTFGQGMPGNDDLQTLTSGQLGVLPQLKKTAAFRTNVGLMNHGSAACNVRVKLFSETGNQLGSTINTSVPAKQWKQINDVFNEAGVGQCQIGYATIEVLTAGGKIWAYGSVVDNGTGDPTTILLFIE